ncbi:hypothetical protein ABZP36_007249 [Zizania latifolia]
MLASRKGLPRSLQEGSRDERKEAEAEAAAAARCRRAANCLAPATHLALKAGRDSPPPPRNRGPRRPSRDVTRFGLPCPRPGAAVSAPRRTDALGKAVVSQNGGILREENEQWRFL